MCNGTYITTEADLEAGKVDNTATASGTDPSGRDVTGSGSNTVPDAPSTDLSVTKTASPTTFRAAGDEVTFTVVVTNTGTATLTNVRVNDPLVPLTCAPGTPVDRLRAGETITCRGTYVVTQADIDSGSVTNTATVTGRNRDGSGVSATGSTQVPGPTADPAIFVAKSSTPTTFGEVGEPITFRVTATNIGNVTLANVRVSDPMVSLTCSPTTPVARLAPGSSVACTGTYTTSQADVDTGSITNTASARGTDPEGRTVANSGSTATMGLAPNPRISLTNVPSVSVATSAGQRITYTMRVTNTGNVTVRGIVVRNRTLLSEPDCNGSRLAPGQSLTCTGPYLVTKADMERGSIVNTATATGTPARGILAAVSATATIRAEEAWIKARETKQQVGQVERITVDRIRESPNLLPPRIKVTCRPIGASVRGDFDYCRWRQTPKGIVIDTVGRPVKVTVTMRAQLRDDSKTWVTKKIVTRTKR
jgi:uncharacterized repeat protein (TIGR01451 family)